MDRFFVGEKWETNAMEEENDGCLGTYIGICIGGWELRQNVEDGFGQRGKSFQTTEIFKRKAGVLTPRVGFFLLKWP